VFGLPRYQLIIKEETFIKLAMEASKQGKSFGKFVNEILNSYADKLEHGVAGDMGPQAVCIVCGAPAKFQGFGKGQQKLYVCPLHKGIVKNLECYGEV